MFTMSARPRLRIVGDHSKYHCGCAAAYRAVARIAKQKGWRVVEPDQEYDAVMVNGEGSMHESSGRFQRKMAEIETAIRAGKPAYLVNTVWQDNPSDYDDLLARTSGICVREVLSQRELLYRHGIKSRVSVDVSFFDRLPLFSLRKNFRGQPAVTDFYWPELKRFASAMHLFPDATPVSMSQLSWGALVASLKTASIFITGRHHGVYAACRAGIPFAASEGNTHKIRGLLATADIKIPLAAKPEEVPDIVAQLDRYADHFDRLFKWMRRQNAYDAIPGPGEVWAAR
jgi:hypothetical protein